MLRINAVRNDHCRERFGFPLLSKRQTETRDHCATSGECLFIATKTEPTNLYAWRGIDVRLPRGFCKVCTM
jgi:hypothetical protein